MKRMKSSGRSSTGSPELVVVLPLINLGKFQKTGSGRYIVSNLRKNQKASAKRLEQKQAKSTFHLSNINQKKEKLTEQDEATLLNLNKEHMVKRRSKNGHSDFSTKQEKKTERSSVTRNNQREIRKKKSETQIPLERTNLEDRFIIEENKLQAAAYHTRESSAQTGMSRRSPSERKKTKYFGEWLEHAELFSRSQSQKKQDKGVEMDQETNVPVIPNVRGNEVYSWKTVADKKKKAEYLADLAAEIELIKGPSTKIVDSTKKEMSTNEELFMAEKPREGEVLMVEKERMSSASETQECVENKISKEKEEFLMKSGLKPVFKKRKAKSLPAALPKPDNKQPKLLDSVCTSKCNLRRPSESTLPKSEEKQDPKIPAKKQSNRRPSHEEPKLLDSRFSSKCNLHKPSESTLATPEGNCAPTKIAAISDDSATSGSSRLTKLAYSHHTLATSEVNCVSTTSAAISRNAATSSSSRLTKLADSYYINRIIRRLHKVDLKILHCLLFLCDARKRPIWRSMLSFEGFDFDKSSQKYECRKIILRRLGESIVKRIAYIFGLTPLNSTLPLNVLINEVMEFLMNLRENEKEPKNKVLQNAHDFFQSGPRSFKRKKILKGLLFEDAEILHIKKVKSASNKFMNSDIDAQVTSELPIANIETNAAFTQAFSSSSGATSEKTRKTGLPFSLMTSGLQIPKQAKEQQVTETEKTELCSVTHKDVSEKSARAPADRDKSLLRSLEESAKVVMTHTGEKEQTLLGFADVDEACDTSSTEVKACTDTSPLKIKQPSISVVKRNKHPIVETFGMHNVVSRNKQISKSGTKINEPPNLPFTEIKGKPSVSPVKGNEHLAVEIIGQHNVVLKKENNEQFSKSEAKMTKPPDISSTEIKGNPSVSAAKSSECALKLISQSNVSFIKTSVQPTAKIMQLVVPQNQGKGQSTLKVNKANGQIMIPLRVIESQQTVTLNQNMQPVAKSQQMKQILIPSVSTNNINLEVPQDSKSLVLPNLAASQVETTAPLDYNSQIHQKNSPNLYVASIAGKLISQPVQLSNFITGKSEKKQMTAPTPHRFYNIVLDKSSTSGTTQQGHSQTIRLPGFAASLSTNASTLAASSASNISPVLNLKQTTMLLIPEATQHKSPTTNLGPKLVQSLKSATSSRLATSSVTNDVSPVTNLVETLPMVQKIMTALNTAITKTRVNVTQTTVQGIMPKSEKNLKFSLNNSDVWNIGHDIENDLPLACDIPPEVITIEDSDCDEETEETKQIPTKEEIFASIHDIISLLELEDINEENISRKLVERFPNIVLSDHQEFIKDSIRKIFL